MATKKTKRGRNRSEGWKHAKVSGHCNEENLAELLRDDEDFGRALGERLFGRDVGKPLDVRGGGSSAAHVDDIFGKSTNGKTDLYIEWHGQRQTNLSVKKSVSGQVFLTGVDRFIAGIEFHFGVEVPKHVIEMLHLFIGTDKNHCDLIMNGRTYLGPKHKGGELQELHQHRVLAVTLAHHFPKSWNALLDWTKANAGNIAEFAFSRGYAKSKTDYATHVWYFVPDGASVEINCLIPIDQIVQHSKIAISEVMIGPRNGGSTILFPFGFLQMHSPKEDNQIQLHHNYAKVQRLCQ
jgi:hypothetical protein